MACLKIHLLVSTFFLPALVFSEIQQHNATVPPISELCLGCICEASSGCDPDKGCEEGACGMFAITEPYWKDAGSPVIFGDSANRAEAYKRCTLDPFCATKAIQGYMNRFAKDCDGDQRVTCLDYAALHHLGAGCRGSQNDNFRSTLMRCLQQITAAFAGSSSASRSLK